MRFRSQPGFRRCLQALRSGEVIAYPTEAVWGLGCDPFNLHAVQAVLDLKRRAPDKGLILVAANIAQFDDLLHDLPAALYDRLLQSWPGPISWLVEHKGRLPYLVCGEHDTVALRVSAHPLVQALCTAFGGPIVSTSANRQGKPAARSALKVRCYFGAHLPLAPGAIGSHPRPSTIKDLRSGEVLRH